MSEKNNKIIRCKPLLGTYIEIEVNGKNQKKDLIELSQYMFEQIKKIENLMNFFNPNSELSEINRNAHKRAISITEDTRNVIAQSLEFFRDSDHNFDIAVAPHLIKKKLLPIQEYKPNFYASSNDIELKKNKIKFKQEMQIDLGGIAKGYAVDQALKIVPPQYDVRVNAGGDLALNHWHGKNAYIKNPERNFVDTVEVEMKNQALATSSFYKFEKIHKIVSPISKKFLKEKKKSVSVFAKRCMIADGLTKIIHLHKNPEKILKKYQANSLILDKYTDYKKIH